MPQFVLNLVRKYLSDPVMKAKIMAWLRYAATAAGVATTTTVGEFIATHLTFFSQTSAMGIATAAGAAVAGLILAIGSAVYGSVVVPNNTAAKISIAAATGSEDLANHAPTVAAVKVAAQSGTPEALQQLLASLKAGIE